MNYVEEPKQRTFDESLENRAIEFHGHDGPYMTIGLRMGLTALEMLDCKGWFDIRCEVRCIWNPPDSCVIDGIQSSTGCTMGKKNITVVEQPGVEAHFTSKKRALTIKLKTEIIEKIRHNMTDKDIPHDLIEQLEKAKLSEIFEIKH